MLSLPFCALYLNMQQGEVLGCPQLIELVLHQVRMQKILHETLLLSQAQMQILMVYIHILHIFLRVPLAVTSS